MKFKTLLISGILLVSTVAAFAQKMKITSGDPGFLKGQKKINVVYDYSNMGVGKFDREEDYVKDKSEKLNEKESGRGDEWKKNWVADRKERFEPKFEELFNKQLEKVGVKVGQFDDAEYTLVLKTTYTEPGFNVGVVRKSAFTNLEAVFMQTGSEEPVMVIALEKSPGRDAMGYDFDTGYRIQESYAKAGKELGQFLVKKKAF
ncbi:hypothetical protein C900_05577 [Fulvivirga imtechensis AK7]|uniref:DUF4410 domain-containing protein n=1 Tax=Fulvivirga imtechensis AK7 TaxID=1237149 RepID=L8JNA8_9BACT|nr:hypothetical protein [Fulvivirga imtechensis]ELR69019.1 hypothetical protein C900_05577 [Fulvivirga imtechensis AK7]